MLQNLELARLRATATAAGTRAFFELEPEANDVYARLEQPDGSFRRYRVLPYFSASADGRVRAHILGWPRAGPGRLELRQACRAHALQGMRATWCCLRGQALKSEAACCRMALGLPC